MPVSYTLSAPASYEEDIKKSRFLALADAVQTPEEAMAFFAANSVADATHNCWAYRIGAEYRFNDDGEPGGTAGRPILQAIEGQQCDRVAVLVIRWFGGVKLGTGGLMRAYGGAAAQCLRLAAKTELVDEVQVSCACDFADIAIFRARLPGFDVRVLDEQFTDTGVRWVLAVPRTEAAALQALHTNLTRGKGMWEPKE
ncbi:YigZ family protein [Pusillimonas sp. ANT_WB101]|uniref:IMPACT family protein n=1 Tax=Pusillimonas sp. ANT_WB101 TaxID=2597356 RepID=UPI0011EED9D4|nr:YigZ family protein [Pusillimonas sp. ANT_WB101]KAA0910929.1 YigZ family protein [Pusillimonas sp. ANT_WB101]